MKRTVPLLITAISGFVLIVSFFLPAIQEWGEISTLWFDILASIAFILGGGNLLKLHLKSISDKKAGWGYSAVTIVAFLLTLAFGLFKFGSIPTPNTEFYGTTFARLPLSELPEYRVDGTIPKRADGEPLPTSVRYQLREEKEQLVFQGWMTINQKEDLLRYQETLGWQCRVEELFNESRPEELVGKFDYRVMHGALSVEGVLTEELKTLLAEALNSSEASKRAIAELEEGSHRKTTIEVASIPESFKIPDSVKDEITLDGNRLTVVGSMSTELRDSISMKWAGFAPAMPLTSQQEKDLLAEIKDRGGSLSVEQQAVFQQFFAAEWSADAMVVAINSAGILAAEDKTACELLDEQIAGATDLVLKKETPEPTLLNDDQKQAVAIFVEQPGQTVEEFTAKLKSLGVLTDKQREAVGEFVDSLPRQADVMKSLGIQLLKVGKLNSAQREFLFAPTAQQYAWRTEVGRLFVAAHEVKYSWSGSYTTQGNPFWWVYEYIFQPLMTTTFAMLAFYVASAAFRAFRAKNLEATLLLGTAFIVLLGRTYLGVQLTAWVPDAYSALKIDQMTVYIMKIFNTAGNRAIMIGIALGIASTSLKVLLGIDRSYLGSRDY